MVPLYCSMPHRSSYASFFHTKIAKGLRLIYGGWPILVLRPVAEDHVLQTPPQSQRAVGSQVLRLFIFFSYSTHTEDKADDDDNKGCDQKDVIVFKEKERTNSREYQ